MAHNEEVGQSRTRPASEWLAGGLGLLITIALISFVGWQALQRLGGPPQINVRVVGIAASGDGYAVMVVAENQSNQTVAGLGVEATLTLTEEEPEMSSTTFDYVPGNSEVRGGLFFQSDPAAGALEVRPTGYRKP